MVTRFSKFYITLFTAIWMGYGLYSLLVSKQNGIIGFFFGLGFSIVFSIAVWFSEWLMKNYRRIDQMSKEALSKK
jgi:ABC-type nitrate/sulfonate/bicarbonate transport system permease component